MPRGLRGCLHLCLTCTRKSKACAVDEERNSVLIYSVVHGTQTGEGGPVPPTGKKVAADYVYVMDFEGDKVRHMPKIWNEGYTLQKLGWA